jgi:hypothetical protein
MGVPTNPAIPATKKVIPILTPMVRISVVRTATQGAMALTYVPEKKPKTMQYTMKAAEEWTAMKAYMQTAEAKQAAMRTLRRPK